MLRLVNVIDEDVGNFSWFPEVTGIYVGDRFNEPVTYLDRRGDVRLQLQSALEGSGVTEFPKMGTIGRALQAVPFWNQVACWSRIVGHRGMRYELG